MLKKYEYRCKLPRYQRDNKIFFITFAPRGDQFFLNKLGIL